MKSRRGFLIKVAAGFAAMAMVVVGTVPTSWLTVLEVLPAKDELPA